MGVIVATEGRVLAATATVRVVVPARSYSLFNVNLPTGQPPHGPPRGELNKMLSLGLPPWAAWCKNLDQYAMYRLAGVYDNGMLPKHESQVDGIWLNERIRERVRTTRKIQFLVRQMKYPWMKTGVWHSDTLDHWIQVPHVHAAQFDIEKEGGFDNFILNRNGRELKSRYGERIRRHILVRQREIQKNFALQQHASKLAETLEDELAAATSKEQLQQVFARYGINASAVAREVRKRSDDGPRQRDAESTAQET